MFLFTIYCSCCREVGICVFEGDITPFSHTKTLQKLLDNSVKSAGILQ